MRKLCKFCFIAAVSFGYSVLFSSCKKQVESHPSWNTDILAPLLKSTLSLNDLVADSILQTNPDHSVSLVFSNELYHASLSDLAVDIPDTAIKVGFSLETINLANQSIVYPYTLGAICEQIPYGDLIIAFNGQIFPIPALEGLTTPETEIDATQFFESADIESGFIDLTIENGLPITMSSMVFVVKNKVDQQILTQDTFINVLPGTSETKTIDLAGKHVEGTLLASVLDLSSPGGNVLIDTSDALVITLTAHDITVSSATAIFPAQNLIDNDQLTTYHLSGGAELKKLRIKSGFLTLNLNSSVAQNSHFEYSLPSAKDAYGNFIFLSKDLPAAPVGGTSNASETFDLSGYTFDLTGPDGTLHNTFYSHLVARIDSTGQLVTISKNDSILIDYELKDIVPDYIFGYVGQQIVNVGPEETGFDIFGNIRSGNLSLENVDVNLEIKNGIGVEGRINIYDLTSVNSATGNAIQLSWTHLNAPLSIPPATDNPFVPSLTSFSLNNSNSNIAALVSNLPDQLTYQLDVFINPYGNASNYNDFAYETSDLIANLDISVPMSLIASELVLIDTLDFSFGVIEEGDAQIKDGTFNLFVYNGFPVSASQQLYFCDDNLNILDSLFETSQTVSSGILNDQCYVSEKTKSLLSVGIDENKMARIRSSTKAILVSSLNTATHPDCDFIKIYDDYTMDVQLTGLFTFFTGY